MKNPIIDEVREARAALAAEHDYDRHQILEWAKKEHAARQKHPKQRSPNQSMKTTADPPRVEG